MVDENVMRPKRRVTCVRFDFGSEGGVRVCGIAVLGYFWCGVAVTFISVQAVCGKFNFHVAVVGEKIVVLR